MTLTDYIEAALNRKVTMETREGVVRSGRLTSIRTQDVKTDKGTIHYPVAVILDGDEVDPIPVAQVVAFTTAD
jgi:hypothetical protein